jgi:hypothetical protein
MFKDYFMNNRMIKNHANEKRNNKRRDCGLPCCTNTNTRKATSSMSGWVIIPTPTRPNSNCTLPYLHMLPTIT